MQLRVGVEYQYISTYPTPATLLAQPHPVAPTRIVQESWDTGGQFHEFADLYGNRTVRLTMPAGESRIRYDALVEWPDEPDPVVPDAIQVGIAELPDEALHFTLASRYCLSDALMGTAWELFGGSEPGWARVQAVCDWIHDNINYGHEFQSTPLTTALDIYNARAGVCRDFAHLGVTFCRALNIPARYVFGYLADEDIPPPIPPQDFHAWFEVYLGGQWYAKDARFNRPMRGRIPVGRGRDAVDVALITSYGPAQLRSMVVTTDVVTGDEQVLAAVMEPASDV